MYIYTPYTYLIGWSHLNLWYYGVRFAKNCHPSDFWIKYFTSSKSVKYTRKHFGEPDIISIRKTFSNKDSAIMWEHKVLKRLKVKNNKKWLNVGVTPNRMGDGHWITNGTDEIFVSKNIEIPTDFRIGRSDLYRKKLSEQVKLHHANDVDGFRGNRISEGRKNLIWINNGTIEKCIKKDQDLIEGFLFGRLPRSESHNNNARKAKKGLMWYTNGIVDKQFKIGKQPKDFSPGRCLRFKRSKESIEKSANFSRGKKWYTDGTINLRAEFCPENFKPGKIQSKRIITSKRDNLL
jgi:hypothetical protein